MVIPSLIESKREGHALPAGSWSALVEAYAAEAVPDYQMAALLMAVVWRGMSPAELTELTGAMLASGARLDFGAWAVPRVDKHSTGGVGDKTSLLLAPMLACSGVAVPMMSGRGLGHTGGTLDKLESIPGFSTQLSLAEAVAQVRRVGCALFGQTGEIAPVDRRLYALRDVTGTVPSIPLIAASIMSKKLAEGLGSLVLDVKAGSGAFLPDEAAALELATTMIALGEAHGVRTVALVTAMDRPLGHACGNALEVEECLLALQGEGPEDLLDVTLALGVEALLAAGVETDASSARRRLQASIATGEALQKFAEIIEEQGGNPAVAEDPALLPQAPCAQVYTASVGGRVEAVHPRPIGRGIIAMGGGRNRVEDRVDHAVGFVVTARPGDQVSAGTPLATIYARDEAGLEAGAAALAEAIVIGPRTPAPRPLVSHRVTASGIVPVAT
ncbi:MAG TPA: thymidine phosphorylase [Gemmatimonadales bacterium]|nr:thymidine phosphorylase [Gemmatimonadales bacterium]